MLRTPGEFQLTRPGAEDCATICDHICLDFHAHRFVLRQQVGIRDATVAPEAIECDSNVFISFKQAVQRLSCPEIFKRPSKRR